MAEIEEPFPHNVSLEAVTAIIRYEAPESARWPQDPEWVNFAYVYNAKKRFYKSVSLEFSKHVIEEEMDRGQPRFLVFTDSEG